MKNCKLRGYLLGTFITSILCVGMANAANYQWLECHPIPDEVTIKYPNGQVSRPIENPSLQNLWEIRQNGETIINPSTTKPSIYIACNAPGVLLQSCPHSDIRTNISNSGGRIKTFNLSGSKDLVAGVYHLEGEDLQWWLEKSEKYPAYWKFNGQVVIDDANILLSRIEGYSNYKYYPIEHNYKCTLRTDTDLEKPIKLGEDNRKYIRYINH